jgi:hypothetical protein
VSDGQALALVRTVHTTIYLVMASAALMVLYGGVTGAHGRWLWVAAGLIGVESLVFAASGLKCPLTDVAVKYGAQEKATLFDTFLPEPITRHTFHVFGPIVVLGFVLLALRWWRLGWS